MNSTTMNLKQAINVFQQAMSGYSGFWCVAGGWAIDLYLEEQTRPHEDLEVIVLRNESKILYGHIQSMDPQKIFSGDPPKFVPWKGEEIEAEVIQLQLRSVKLNKQKIDFDLLLTPSESGQWICRREEAIRRPLKDIVQISQDGIPFLVPEIVLLFKAKYVREKDTKDFERVIFRLNREAKIWLRTSLDRIHPSHQWLPKI